VVERQLSTDLKKKTRVVTHKKVPKGHELKEKYND
jgi:hypothetical protein